MNNFINELENNKIMAILRGVDEEKILPLANALIDAGIKFIEITFDRSGNVSDEKTFSYLKMLSENLKDKCYVGAGTVLTKKQVKMVKDAGATYVVSPNTDKKIIKYTKKLGLVSIPGAVTPTEILNANSYGADIVKIFPAGDLGKKYLKSIMAPLKGIKMLFAGGINKDEAKDYLSLGAVALGLASNIIDKESLEKGDFNKVSEFAKQYIESIK